MTCCFRRFPVALLLELAQLVLLFLLIPLGLCVQIVQAAPVSLRRALAIGTTTFAMLVSHVPSGLALYPSVVFACIAAELGLLDSSEPSLPVAIARRRS